MEAKVKEKAKARKNNMKLYPMYGMIGLDCIFFYAVQVLFMTQVKHIAIADVVLSSSFFAFCSIFLQIPCSILVEKIGARKSLIIGNVLNVISLFVFVFSRNFTDILIYQFISAIAYALKGIAEPAILNHSIPDTERKGEIFSHISAKGYSKYCYLCASSAVISGFFYDMNPYIPFALCIIALIITVVISFSFVEVKQEQQEQKKKQKTFKESLQEVKIGFRFIFQSSRLKCLLLMTGIIWGLLCLFSTYEVALMEKMGISATFIGIVLAIMQILTGTVSVGANHFHDRFRNKSLTVLAYSCTIGTFVAGLVVFCNIPMAGAVVLVLLTYGIRAAAKGVFTIIKQRYLNNFTDEAILPKIYGANGIFSNLTRMTIGVIGSVILKIVEVPQAMMITGCIFSVLIFLLSQYMKPKLGLKPEEYQKKDIEYRVVK